MEGRLYRNAFYRTLKIKTQFTKKKVPNACIFPLKVKKLAQSTLKSWNLV